MPLPSVPISETTKEIKSEQEIISEPSISASSEELNIPKTITRTETPKITSPEIIDEPTTVKKPSIVPSIYPDRGIIETPETQKINITSPQISTVPTTQPGVFTSPQLKTPTQTFPEPTTQPKLVSPRISAPTRVTTRVGRPEINFPFQEETPIKKVEKISSKKFKSFAAGFIHYEKKKKKAPYIRASSPDGKTVIVQWGEDRFIMSLK